MVRAASIINKDLAELSKLFLSMLSRIKDPNKKKLASNC